MLSNKSKEDDFYKKEFSFSYSSISKLLYSPVLFYDHYILREREDRDYSHLIGGRLIHCLLLEPDVFNTKYAVSNSKIPTKTLKPLLDSIAYKNINDNNNLEDHKDDILLYLSGINLYQSLKDDAGRLEKVITAANIEYFEHKKSTIGKEIIDQDLLTKCEEAVKIIKSNKSVRKLLHLDGVNLFTNNVEVHNERELSCKLKGYDFGLRGVLDNYTIDHTNKIITINDFKTTGKGILEFPESVEYYKYWLQASLYKKLLYNNLNESMKNWKFMFNFIVIDKYNQVYPFPVSDNSLGKWEEETNSVLEKVNYHYSNKNYSLPYELATEGVIL